MISEFTIDVSPTGGDDQWIVIFDRTRCTDDGEWGDEIASFYGNFDDLEADLTAAGFTVKWHSNYNFGNESGEIYTAVGPTN